MLSGMESNEPPYPAPWCLCGRSSCPSEKLLTRNGAHAIGNDPIFAANRNTIRSQIASAVRSPARYLRASSRSFR